MYNHKISCKKIVFYFWNDRLNNHSIFNLLYFLCCQTFDAALVNAFYECIHDVYTHLNTCNFSFLRVFSHSPPIGTANLFYRCTTGIMSNQVFIFIVPICQSCCIMTHFRPNPVMSFRGIYMHSLGVMAEVLTSVVVLLVSVC